MANVKKARVLRMLFCDFCGKGQDQCALLIQGRDAVHICAECVSVCAEMVLEDKALRKVEQPPLVDAADSVSADLLAPTVGA